MSAGGFVRSLRDQIVDKLRSDILAGRYKEGDAIRQEEVVSRYKVSRTPIREAFIQLAEEGLLLHVPNRGMRVARLAPDSVHEFLIPLRRTIESYAVRLCYASLTEDDFKDWELILERMRLACEQKDYAALSEADIAFHKFLVDRAREPAISKIWNTILGQVRAYFLRYHQQYDDLMVVYREHAAIVEIFRRGDETAAIEFLAARIDDPASVGLFKDLVRLASGEQKTQSA